MHVNHMYFAVKPVGIFDIFDSHHSPNRKWNFYRAAFYPVSQFHNLWNQLNAGGSNLLVAMLLPACIHL